jgi:hypothetical protein
VTSKAPSVPKHIRTPEIQSRDVANVLQSDDVAQLQILGVKTGVNSAADNNNIWIGTGGFFDTTFTNNATTKIILVVWSGTDSSFVGATAPQITYPLDAGASVTLGIADSVAGGGFSAIYPETTMNMAGQIDNTWGEFTTGGVYSTIDISREVNMSGRAMSIDSKTSGCKADMETCAFVCKDGADTCWVAGSYELLNCDNNVNNNDNADSTSGGCQMGNGGVVDVTFY